ncbi:histidine kinase [Pseudomonas sp. SDO528_S397]
MPTSSLRILVVDTLHERCLSIEKMLNHQGYHRIAPVTSLDELLTMVENAVTPFDLLVVNSALTGTSASSLVALFRYCSAVRHTLIYESPPLDPLTLLPAPGSKTIKTLAHPPDHETIKAFMQAIDP